MLRRNLRLVTTLVGLVSGIILTVFSLEPIRELLNLGAGQGWMSILTITLGGLFGALIGFAAAPAALWVEVRLARTDLVDLVLGAIGLIVGLIIASLLALTVGRIAYIGPTLSAIGGLVFAYLGISVAARKRGELEKWIAGARLFRHEAKERGPSVEAAASAAPALPASTPKILDTSVIIDGRVAEILATGFLEGPVVIPNFVLDELRHIADSSDVLKRNRGRRGLDILNQIQKELRVEVQIYEEELGENIEVDSKLLKLGKLLNGKVVTNDYNLNKVAELQGVPVLNINELANAVKPAVLPGEEMQVTVVKDGKEAGQGVAYLDDGTMIVVDGGRRFMNETLEVIVTSVLQTAAGRMIFARPKLERVAP